MAKNFSSWSNEGLAPPSHYPGQAGYDRAKGAAGQDWADYIADTSQAGNQDYQEDRARSVSAAKTNEDEYQRLSGLGAYQSAAAPTPWGGSYGDKGWNRDELQQIHNTAYPSAPLAGLQTAAGVTPATALSAQAATATSTGAAPGPTQLPTPAGQAAPPQQPLTAATPAIPAKPKRRMITQSSHSLQGLRAANGAGY